MNKFNIENPSGGFVLKAHDLNFIYDSLKEGVGGLAGREDAILGGCRVSTDLVASSTMTEGFVSLGGEVYKVEAQAWNPTVITDPCLTPVETVTTPSPRMSADGNSKDVHFKRVARVEQFGAQAVKKRFNELGDYGYAYRAVLGAVSGTVYDTFYTGSWLPATADMLAAGFETLKLRKTGRYLELVGTCAINSFVASQIAALPNLVTAFDGARLIPAKNNMIVVPLAVIGAGPGLSYTADNTVNVVVNTDGEISVVGGSYSSDGPVFLVFNHRIPLF
jgi:hypothetical protein